MADTDTRTPREVAASMREHGLAPHFYSTFYAQHRAERSTDSPSLARMAYVVDSVGVAMHAAEHSANPWSADAERRAYLSNPPGGRHMAEV